MMSSRGAFSNSHHVLGPPQPRLAGPNPLCLLNVSGSTTVEAFLELGSERGRLDLGRRSYDKLIKQSTLGTIISTQLKLMEMRKKLEMHCTSPASRGTIYGLQRNILEVTLH